MVVQDTFFIVELLVLIKVYVAPYLAFSLGIYIRNQCLPETHPPTLKKLLLLGVPVYFVAVAPILLAAQEILTELSYGYMLTLGLVMEQGMVVHETAASRMAQAIKHSTAQPSQLQSA